MLSIHQGDDHVLHETLGACANPPIGTMQSAMYSLNFDCPQAVAGVHGSQGRRSVWSIF